MVFTEKHQIISFNMLPWKTEPWFIMLKRSSKERKEVYLMTRNQIDYWNLQEQIANNRRVNEETRKHNRAMEEETSKHNRATESQAARDLTERAMHNAGVRSETQRSNIARESENRRTNQANEQINQQRNMLTSLNQLEMARSNRANEAIKRISTLTDLRNSAIQGQRVSQEYTLGTVRNQLTKQAQMEQRRLNALNYELGTTRNRIAASTLQANIRRDLIQREMELNRQELTNRQLLEQQRHNEVSELLGVGNILGNSLKFVVGGKR